MTPPWPGPVALPTVVLLGAGVGACKPSAPPPASGPPTAVAPLGALGDASLALASAPADAAALDDAAAAPADAAAPLADAAPAAGPIRLPVGHDELVIGRAGARRAFVWPAPGGDVDITVGWDADEDEGADDPLHVGIAVSRAGATLWSCPSPECELDCVGCDLGLAVTAGGTLWIAGLSWNKARTVPEAVRRLRWRKGQLRVEEIEDPCPLAPRVLLWAEYCDELAAN